MLIETYEGKYGDVVFSKNKFDFLTNFVLVSKEKSDVKKLLDFKEIGLFINKPIKKNLILYRLLTNDQELDPFTSKLGFFLKVEERMEILYFDPVFIFEDLKHLKITIPKDEFTFKIQQVGFRTDFIDDNNIIFKEHFAIDMTNDEAKNQNDSIFAETMLSVGSKNEIEIFNNESKSEVFSSAEKTDDNSDNKFYKIGKSESTEKVNIPIKESELKETKDDSGFLKRVMSKKNKKTNYDSDKLKMFR